MEVKGEYVFEAPREEVWKALLDPVVLASIMPGCDKLELVDGVYQGVLKVKVGPVQGTFDGRVELKDIVAPVGYRMNVDGKGQQGFVKADAGVQLEAVAERQTRMAYEAEAKVGGKIASVGQRLIDASAKAIIKQSLEGLHEVIKVRSAHSDTVAAAAAQAAEAERAAAEAKARGDAAAAEEAQRAAEAAKAAAAAAPAPLPQAQSQAALAAAVAREVTKELIPAPVRTGAIVVVLLLALYGLYALVAWR